MDFTSANICCISLMLGVFINENENEYVKFIAYGIIVSANTLYLFMIISHIISERKIFK